MICYLDSILRVKFLEGNVSILQKILKMIEENGFQCLASRKLWLEHKESEEFYKMHRGDFSIYIDMTHLICSGATVFLKGNLSPQTT